MTGKTLIEKVIPNAKVENVLNLFYDALKQYSRYLYYEKLLVNDIEVLHSHTFLDIHPPNNNRIVVTDILVPEVRKKGEVRMPVRIDALIINAWQIQEDRLVIKIEYTDFFKNIIEDILTKFNYDDDETLVSVKRSAAQAERKNISKSRKAKKSHVPTRKAEQRKWALAYEFYDKHCGLQKLNAMQFLLFCDGYDGFDRPKWIPQDKETLQNLIDDGNNGHIPKYEDIK